MRLLYKACVNSCSIVPLEGVIIEDKIILGSGRAIQKENSYVRIAETWDEAYSFLESNLAVELNEARQKLAELIDKQDVLVKIFKRHHGYHSHGVA